MTINERIELIIKNLGFNKNSFSVAIGVNPTVIHNIIKGRNAPGYDVLSKISLSFDNIDMNWMLSGVGTMFKKTSRETVVSDIEHSYNGPNRTESPPGETCEKCKMKDEMIALLRHQVETQDRLIQHLEIEKSPLEDGQKRKAN